MTRKRNNGFLFKGFPLTSLGEPVQWFLEDSSLYTLPRPASVILSSYTTGLLGTNYMGQILILIQF